MYPPVHHLVASYLQYSRPEPVEDVDYDESSDDAPVNRRAEWLGDMGGVPASQALKEAATAEEALAAAERMFFGDVNEFL
jgi:hypothetical protein